MVKRIFYILLFFLVTVLVQSCLINATGILDDRLSIEQTESRDNKLRLDGYYYYVNYNENYDKDYASGTYFFYNNGIIVTLGGFDILDKWEKHEERILTNELIDAVQKIKYAWGLFNIDNNIIKFERWYPSSGGPLKAYVRKGIILNDTTFVIKESYRMVNGKKRDLDKENETYHFKQFSPKPDSTNRFTQ